MIVLNQPPTTGILTEKQAHYEYQVDVATPSNLRIKLENWEGNADLVLLNSDKQAVNMGGNPINSTNLGTMPEIVDILSYMPQSGDFIALLKPGTYYVQVTLGEGSTAANYTLSVSDEFDSVADALHLGKLEKEFGYRDAFMKEARYDFTVDEALDYNFYVMVPDKEAKVEVMIKGPDGKKTKLGAPTDKEELAALEQMPVQMFEANDMHLEPGEYTLTIKGKKGVKVQYFFSGISKAEMDRLKAESERQQQEFEEQMQKMQEQQEAQSQHPDSSKSVMVPSDAPVASEAPAVDASAS